MSIPVGLCQDPVGENPRGCSDPPVPRLPIRTSNTAFKESLKQIEGGSECGGLPMISFLILPMQRVTRLPLLLDVRFPLLPHPPSQHALLSRFRKCALTKYMSPPRSSPQTICQKTKDKTAEYFAAVWALHAMSKVEASTVTHLEGGVGGVLSSHVTVVIVASTAGQQL